MWNFVSLKLVQDNPSNPTVTTPSHLHHGWETAHARGWVATSPHRRIRTPRHRRRHRNLKIGQRERHHLKKTNNIYGSYIAGFPMLNGHSLCISNTTFSCGSLVATFTAKWLTSRIWLETPLLYVIQIRRPCSCPYVHIHVGLYVHVGMSPYQHKRVHVLLPGHHVPSQRWVYRSAFGSCKWLEMRIVRTVRTPKSCCRSHQRFEVACFECSQKIYHLVKVLVKVSGKSKKLKNIK